MSHQTHRTARNTSSGRNILTITTSKSRSPMRYAASRTRAFFSLQRLIALFLSTAAWALAAQAYGPSPNENPVKQLTLQQLGEVEVTTASKTPEQVWKTAAAIYVITREDIARSGATSIPEVLRLAPGVEVRALTATSGRWNPRVRQSPLA